jgi:hypothetical protein
VHLRVHTYTWRDGGWALTAERVFARGVEPLRLGPGARKPPATDTSSEPLPRRRDAS